MNEDVYLDQGVSYLTMTQVVSGKDIKDSNPGRLLPCKALARFFNLDGTSSFYSWIERGVYMLPSCPHNFPN